MIYYYIYVLDGMLKKILCSIRNPPIMIYNVLDGMLNKSLSAFPLQGTRLTIKRIRLKHWMCFVSYFCTCGFRQVVDIFQQFESSRSSFNDISIYEHCVVPWPWHMLSGSHNNHMTVTSWIIQTICIHAWWK